MGYPTVPGYSVESSQGFEGFNIIEGESVFRALSPSGGTDQLATLSFLMSPAQFAYFEGWWYWRIAKGAHWFVMPLRTGNELEAYDCHMVGGYKSTYVQGSDAWEVAFDVEYMYSRGRNNFPKLLPEDHPRYLFLEDHSHLLQENNLSRGRMLLEQGAQQTTTQHLLLEDLSPLLEEADQNYGLMPLEGRTL